MRLLSLSRAARLVGQSRGILQKQVQNGELTSFEGKISLDELISLYPLAEVEDNVMLDKVEEIIERARFKARTRTTLPPDRETLTARLSLLSDDLAQSRQELSDHHIFMEKLKSRLKDMSAKAGSEGKAVLAELAQWLTEQTISSRPASAAQRQLLAQDTILRIMAAQVHLHPSGHEFLVEGNNTLLESGLSAGFALNYGCSNGNCGMCKARLIKGEVKKVRQHDYVLTEAEKAQNMILMCSHTALTDVELEADEAGTYSDIPAQTINAWVKKQQAVSEGIQILNLRTPRTKRLRFLAGQRVQLTSEKGHTINLPVASCPCDEMNLQFHIDVSDPNPFCQEVLEGMKMGAGIRIDGPSGDFVLQEEPPHPFLLLAMDTGFAPIKSLLEHALTLDVAESLHLYRFTTLDTTPYLDNLCRSWDDAFETLTYEALACDKPQTADSKTCRALFDKIATGHPELDRYQAYIAGPATFVDAAVNFCQQQGLAAGLIRQAVV